MHFILNGDPVPLSRCRFVSKDVIGKQRELKMHARRTIEHQFDELDVKPFHAVPLALHVVFYMPLPKRATRRKEYKKIYYNRWNPSILQLVRLIVEVTQGIVFESDCAICHVSTDKVFDENPRTEIHIKEL